MRGIWSEWMADKPTKVGIASVGYANGYPRLPKGAYATLNGTPAPVIGRVSMEMTALDLSANPDAKAQDTAIMWGDSPTIDEIAAAAGTISYDLLTKSTTP